MSAIGQKRAFSGQEANAEPQARSPLFAKPSKTACLDIPKFPGGRPQTMTSPVTALQLRRIALLLWVLSFLAPAVRYPSGEVMLGFQLVGQVVYMAVLIFLPFGFLAAPLVASACTNLLFFHELVSAFRRSARHSDLPGPVWSAVALGVNIVVPLKYSHLRDAPPIGLPGLTSLPGYYLWLAAFFILLVASLDERYDLRALAPPMVKRLFLVAVVAVISIVGLGTVALVLN